MFGQCLPIVKRWVKCFNFNFNFNSTSDRELILGKLSFSEVKVDHLNIHIAK